MMSAQMSLDQLMDETEATISESQATRAALSRITDPATSQDAGESVRPHLAAMQAEVLQCLAGYWKGATSYEIMQRLNHAGRGRQQNSVATRLAALHDLGFILDTGDRRPGSSNRLLIVWRVTEAGRAAVRS